jgi:hypothetical protein
LQVWVWPGTLANYEIDVTFSLLYASCLWTLKLAFSFCEVQYLFCCPSFQIISTIHPASYPNGTRKSSLGTTIASGCIKPHTFSYCLGLECVGKFTSMSSQCYCGVVLMHRDNFIFRCCKTVLCSILKQWEKVLRVLRRVRLRTSHALHCIASKSPLVNVRLHKTPVMNKVIIVTTSNIHVNRLARHLAGNKRNTVDGEAYIFIGDV